MERFLDLEATQPMGVAERWDGFPMFADVRQEFGGCRGPSCFRDLHQPKDMCPLERVKQNVITDPF
jgi:hypothetical protein